MIRRIGKDQGRTGPTTFLIAPRDLPKWIRQNRAEYTGDFAEGCLLDNFVLSCRRGFAAVYEHYLNCWSSDYLIEFEPGPAPGVWHGWNEFTRTQGEV